VVGVEDGSFQKGISKKTKLVAVLLVGAAIKAVKIAHVTVDGMDATEVLTKMVEGWLFEAIFLAGVSFAGFNVIDPTTIYKRYGKPIVVISRTKPNNEAVKRALQRHFEDWEKRWGIFRKLGKVREVKVLEDAKPIYMELLGETDEWAYKLVQALSFCGRMPEPLRVARIIARGVS
jgi:endonuclease V-like protein UPF0215 family